jgi:serine/threonine protein kinase
LNAAHRAKIVHRDLKPANVFLMDVPGEGTIVKLLDFGISKQLGNQHRLTGEYDVLGTPDYMPPEQALGRTAEVDARSDQYSLAVIVYEAIAGQTPFTGNDVAEVLERVIENDPIPLSRFAPDVPSGVGAVLRRAMAKEPEGRYDTVLNFAAALLPAAGYSFPPPSEPVSLLPPPPRHLSVPPESAIAARSLGRRPTPREEAETEPPPPALRYPSFAPTDLGSVLDQAREAFGLGDLELAVSYVESALALADRLGNDKDQRLERANVLIESVLRSRLGPSNGRLRIRHAPSDVSLLPEQAFLLSRLEGHSAVEEILDLSPLSRRATLRHLVALLRQGVLALD